MEELEGGDGSGWGQPDESHASFFGDTTSFFGASGPPVTHGNFVAPTEAMQQHAQHEAHASIAAEPSHASDAAGIHTLQDIDHAGVALPMPGDAVDQQLQAHQQAEQVHASPSDHTDTRSALQQQQDALKAQHASYHTWLMDYLSQADSGAEQSGGPGDVPGLLGSLYSAWLARTYLHYHKEAAEAGKELERRLREAENLRTQLPAASSSDGPDAVLAQYLAAVQECIAALATALAAQEAATFYAAPAWQALPQLQGAAAALDQRLQQSRYSLYQQVVQDIQNTLEAAGWPPPLVPGERSSGGGRASGGLSEGFHGFGAATAGGPAVLSRLNGLLASLNQLQLATERQQFAVLAQQAQPQEGGQEGGGGGDAAAAAVREGPLLWSMAQLTSQLQVRLQSHFTPGTEAGRLDHPEWLFKIVIGILKAYTGYTEELQPSIVAAGLQSHYHAAVEFARAVREAVRAVLRGSRLPALLQEAQGQHYMLWVLQVDAILDFEKQLAPYMGALHQATDAEHELPESLAAGSCLAAVTQEPDFMSAWAAAERAVAESRVAPFEVHPPGPSGSHTSGAGPHSWGGVDAQQHAGAHAPWKREFHPPAVAERVVDAVTALVERSRHVPTAQDQRVFLELSVGPLLDSVQQLLHDTLQAASEGWEAESYGAAAAGGAGSGESAAMLCACVNAAHYLHHQLSELLLGPALHRLNQPQSPGEDPSASDPSAAAAAAAAGAGAMARPPNGTYGFHGSFGSSAGLGVSAPALGAGFGDVVVRHSFAPAEQPAAVLAARAAALAALHREWCLRAARDVARGFGRLAVEYREEVVRAGFYPTHHGVPHSPSPQLLPALAWLQQRLALLAEHLDAPSFRDIWRAVLVPINRFLFNHIATECRFTPEGGAQLDADIRALAGILAPYTGRPTAHLRESLAAAKLLSLNDDEAGEVVRRVSGLAAAGAGLEGGELGPAYKKDSLLVHLGATCLLPQQIMAVVQCRG